MNRLLIAIKVVLIFSAALLAPYAAATVAGAMQALMWAW